MPAAIARTAASPGEAILVIAAIFIESDTIRPSNPGRNSVPITVGLKVAGCFAGSIAGSSICATMTAAAPAAMPLLNGGSSMASSRSRGCATIGRPRWESTSVSPWPGKCLSVASMPASCRPRAKPDTIAPTRAGSSPNERMLITGLRGLLLTSATGAKSMCTPSARDSAPTTLPAW